MEQVWPGRSAEQRSAAWVARHMSRVEAALAAMSRGLGERTWCTGGTQLTLADIAVGCALGYLDFRFGSIDWRGAHANLARLYDKLQARPSFVETRPPA
jgi:glutathione S-transferase